MASVDNYLGNMNFNLSNGGQAISLYDAAGTPNLVDTVTYDDASPWPTASDGNGPTLELKNAKLDNASAANWSASTSHGTPGSINSAHCYSLTTSVTGSHGTLLPVSGKKDFGDVVTLTATPDPGYKVKKWTGTDDDASVSTTNKVIVRADASVNVEFAPESPSPTPTPTDGPTATPTPDASGTPTVTPTPSATVTPTDGVFQG